MVQGTGSFGGAILQALACDMFEADSCRESVSGVWVHAPSSISAAMVVMVILKYRLYKVPAPGHATPYNGDKYQAEHHGG